MPTDVIIGIGSNLADPQQQVLDVIPYLNKIKDTTLTKQSSLFQTEAVGDTSQQDYINAVVKLKTSLQPYQLLLELQSIEYAFYRQRLEEVKWAPRTMDLDIILFGDSVQNDSHLTIPHPEMKNRLFVLLPLLEIEGNIVIPEQGDLTSLIKQAPILRVQKLTL